MYHTKKEFYPIHEYFSKISCDQCGKFISLSGYYQQDGLCSKCFVEWLNAI